MSLERRLHPLARVDSVPLDVPTGGMVDHLPVGAHRDLAPRLEMVHDPGVVDQFSRAAQHVPETQSLVQSRGEEEEAVRGEAETCYPELMGVSWGVAHRREEPVALPRQPAETFKTQFLLGKGIVYE